MYSKIKTAVNWGIEGQIVEIETKILRGLPNHIIVGLPSVIIKESKERVKAALKATKLKFPEDRIIQNLFPANIKKEGSQLDLPIAVGISACLNHPSALDLEKIAFLGELSLEGKIQPVQGILSLIDGLKNNGVDKIVIPIDNISEAKYIVGVTIYPYKALSDLLEDLNNDQLKPYENEFEDLQEFPRFDVDISEVIGQNSAIRAVEIAIAGFHNLLIIGPPGCGKSMLVERLTSLMPPMSLNEKIEVTKIYGISEGETFNGLMKYRPFRAPHHTISRIGLVGGGLNILPGEISKAHNGILYLDEIGEFKSDAIESLREPLSSGNVNLTKGGRSITYPSNFMLVATMNPCPCGHYLSKDQACTCSQNEIKRYFGKLSWPILDRLDMTIYMERVDDLERLLKHYESQSEILSSRHIREKIQLAVNFKSKREMTNQISKERLSVEAEQMVVKYHERGKLSMRSYEKLIRISRTIADLELSEIIEKHHVLEAFSYQTSGQVKRFFV